MRDAANQAIRRLRAWLRLVLRHWLVRLALFALPGLLVLLLMNANWSKHIANIGCIGSGAEYRMEQLFVTGGKAGCVFSVRVHQASERIVPTALDAQAANPVPWARRPVAIADGRFQWMTFHLIATVLFSVITLIAVAVLHRNLGRGLRAWSVIGVAAIGGLGWWIYSLARSAGLAMDTASLLVPTRIHALSHFDASFRDLAWQGVQQDYGWGLAVTILITFAAASILADGGTRSAAMIAAKRRDLKLVVAAAALLMTFLAFYVGEWLAWPARFAPSGSFRGSREEFEAVAGGLRLYFGTGYSLALIAAATPAILMLPKPAKVKAWATDSPAAKEGEEAYLYQSLFSKDEASLLLSVMTPFLATLAGGALQL